MTSTGQDFRAWVRTHHPDVGGDLEEFITGLERWRGLGRERPTRTEVSVFRSRGGWWLVVRWWRRRCRTARRVL